MEKIRIAVLASGNGSNLQAIIEATQTEVLSCAEIVLVLSNKKEAGAIRRAEQAKIEALFLDPKNFPSRTDYFNQIADKLEKRRVQILCLAGFLLKCETNLIARFRNRILNIHPALLPKFGGKGMYGRRVHEAVLKAGEKESGCTVHLVDEEYDHGPILLQKKVSVLPEDTPETLAARVLEVEHQIYPEAIRLVIEKELKINPH